MVQLEIYNARYLLHYLLRYYKYNTTRSKISCLPCDFRKEKKKKRIIKQNYIELLYTQKEKSVERGIERGLRGCLTDGKDFIEFNQIDQFLG